MFQSAFIKMTLITAHAHPHLWKRHSGMDFLTFLLEEFISNYKLCMYPNFVFIQIFIKMFVVISVTLATVKVEINTDPSHKGYFNKHISRNGWKIMFVFWLQGSKIGPLGTFNARTCGSLSSSLFTKWFLRKKCFNILMQFNIVNHAKRSTLTFATYLYLLSN